MSNLRKRSELLAKLLLPETATEVEKAMANMRFVSNVSGEVYEDQVKLLKSLANLAFSPAVAVISLNQDQRLISIESDGAATIYTAKFPEMAKKVLGNSWQVHMSFSNKPKKTKPKPKKRKK